MRGIPASDQHFLHHQMLLTWPGTARETKQQRQDIAQPAGKAVRMADSQNCRCLAKVYIRVDRRHIHIRFQSKLSQVILLALPWSLEELILKNHKTEKSVVFWQAGCRNWHTTLLSDLLWEYACKVKWILHQTRKLLVSLWSFFLIHIRTVVNLSCLWFNKIRFHILFY